MPWRPPPKLSQVWQGVDSFKLLLSMPRMTCCAFLPTHLVLNMVNFIVR